MVEPQKSGEGIVEPFHLYRCRLKLDLLHENLSSFQPRFQNSRMLAAQDIHPHGKSTVGQLQPTISPGYGFTAIIVAFLGRLNPIGVLFAGLMLGISYLGGEAAQVTLGMSDKIAKVFQGILLFFILACDSMILCSYASRSGCCARSAAVGNAPGATALTLISC